MKPCYAYIRVSTTKQGEGVSLQEQRSAIERFAEKNSLQVIEWFEEQETAAKRGRPIFTRMLKQLQKGRVSAVVIHKIDRSARNLKDWADLGELIDGGIDVHFAHETLDLRTRGGRLAADIQAVVASDYIRNLKEETRKGLQGRLKQGLYPLPAPIGYLDQGKGKAKILDPQRAPLVRKLFHLYATGKYNLNAMVEQARTIGLTNKNGGPFSRNGLWKTLSNPFFTGLILIRRTGETFPGIHEPLVETSVFKEVQAILHGRAVVATRRLHFEYRRFLRCEHCGHSLIGEIQKGNTYYRCHTLGCLTRSLRETLLEEQIQEKIAPLTFDTADREHLAERIAVIRKDTAREHESQIKALELSANALDERLNRLTDAFLDQTIDPQTFNRKNAEWLLRRRELADQMRTVKARPDVVLNKLEEFLELTASAQLSHRIAIPHERRQLLEKVTSNCLVAGKNVSMKLKSPFKVLENYLQMTHGAPSRDRPRTLDTLLAKLLQLFSEDPEVLNRKEAA
jgi:site-specific DNA recombinase